MFLNFLRFLVVTTCVVNSLQHEGRHENGTLPDISGNAIFDSVLQNLVNDETGLKHLRAVPIPDLKRELKFNFLMLRSSVSLTATCGVLTDLTSVRRVGDVARRTLGNTAYLTAELALDDLHVVFHKYVIQLSIFHRTGDRLTLNVGENRFHVTLKIHLDGTDCRLSLEDLKVSKLSKIKMSRLGFSIFNFISPRIVSWFVEYFYKLVLGVKNTYGRGLLSYEIKDKKICESLLEDNVGGRVATETFPHEDENVVSNPVNKPVIPVETHPIDRPNSEENDGSLQTEEPKLPATFIQGDVSSSTLLPNGKPTDLPNSEGNDGSLQTVEPKLPGTFIEGDVSPPLPNGQNVASHPTSDDSYDDILQMIAAIPGIPDA